MSARNNTPELDIDDILQCIKEAVRKADTEEDLRVRVSACIEGKILKPLGLESVTGGKYEYTLVSGARLDALYGHVIIEYKKPGKLSSQRDIQSAKEQVVNYIKGEAEEKPAYSRYLGVLISDRIAFVKYDPRNDNWILRGPYEINRENIIKLIEALRGLRRKTLDANNLINDFGPKSQIAKKMIRVLYDKIKKSANPRTRTLFDDWMRLFKQATGYEQERLKELSELASEYGLPNNIDYDTLIFAIQTYYALLMKLIAAEIAYLYGGGKLYRSYVAELDDAYSREGVNGIKDVLNDLESGGIFRKLLNIENFLEGDYFSWYLNELDGDLADSIAEMARILSNYEVATPQLEPEFAKDLLKRLYQNLVPGDLRHKLGEFYTPDWLANLVLDEVGLCLDNLLKMGEGNSLKPLELRVLDPACGSGTFLIAYISRLRRYAEEHYLVDQLLNYVLRNVVGFDLNPLAVLAARTNYLLAIADLLGYARGKIEIPVYLADSIMIEKSTQLTGQVYVLRTVVGEFRIPKNIIDGRLLADILAEISQDLRNKYSKEEFKERIKYTFNSIKDDDIDALTELYEKLLKLEEEGKDDVWISVLRNAFAPILKGKFDYVVGNPPWVSWENLPDIYREISKDLWDKYGLLKTIKTGGFKKDLAMLFLARSFDLYLNVGGKLGFLMPFTVFKVQAGAGFRNFLTRKTLIHVIHDLVTLYPFEGAVNRTAAIVVEKVCELSDMNGVGKCPQINDIYKNNMSRVKNIIWANLSKKKPIPMDMPLDEVLKNTKRYQAIMVPLLQNDPSSSWMQVTPGIVEAIRKLATGVQYYEAHAGVYVGLNQVYFVKILEKLRNGNLSITNEPESGQKKKVTQVEAIVEHELVYPLIRGRDVKRWYVDYKDRYVIIPHEPTSGKPISQSILKVKFPLTFDYLNQYKDELKKRSIKPFLSLREKIKKAKNGVERKNAENRIDENFYIVDDIGSYTFAPYKVVWKSIAGAITGKATEFACAVVEPLSTAFVSSKPVILDHGTIMIGFNDRDEAYYVSGFLNSSVVRTVIAAYTYELGQYTHIVDTIKIPKYNPSNELHRKISELSKKAHEIAKEIYENGRKDLEDELKKIEDEIDIAVTESLGLSESDLKEFKRLLAILSNEELPEEEVEVPLLEKPSLTVLNTALKPDVESNIEVEVVNPSGEEIEIYYELPWEKGSFKIIDGEYKIRTPPLEPGKYDGKLRWMWHGKEEVINFTIEVSQPTGPKRRKVL